jgi:hemoglobin
VTLAETRPGHVRLAAGAPRPPDLDSEERISEMVRDFYRQVAMDDLLGPVFVDERVDWSAHIPKLTAFWSWQLLGRPGYEGSPLRAHAPVHERIPFRTEHYVRWLELFVGTVDDGYAGPVADMAKQRARRMARALRRVLGGEQTAGSSSIAPTFGTIRRLT